MHLELTDEHTEALIRELTHIIDGDRYRLSPHIRALKEILGQLRPEPAREAAAPTTALRAASLETVSETRVAS
jgi:hypothetical protein